MVAKDKSATIYTDSRYAFGAAHDFAQIWKQRGFLTSCGKPIKHHQLIKDLLDAIMLPKRLAIVKCEAHTNGSDSVSLGNARADAAAKQAAISSPSVVQQCTKVQAPDPIALPSFDDVAV